MGVKVPGIEDSEAVLREALVQWKSGIDTHDPRAVASVFTDDAIFQGLRPFSVGPQGVFDYYDSQPVGMTVDFSILESRRLSDNAALGYVAATFAYPDRAAVELRLGVVVTKGSNGWRIAYYQASPVPD
ncbi:hypothetical protein ACTXG7_28805 [Mycolicibacterium sp. Dal123E01]|uniref:hypothetical protein n=1 Tax=Mycolicibacterium sp. Dal123E01 TaxID=3457578 RepID=UPI00403E6B8A